jgi:hypothetical protein
MGWSLGSHGECYRLIQDLNLGPMCFELSSRGILRSWTPSSKWVKIKKMPEDNFVQNSLLHGNRTWREGMTLFGVWKPWGSSLSAAYELCQGLERFSEIFPLPYGKKETEYFLFLMKSELLHISRVCRRLSTITEVQLDGTSNHLR